MFTKRHYFIVASILMRADTKNQAVEEFCKYFGENNKRFNKELFTKACYDYPRIG